VYDFTLLSYVTVGHTFILIKSSHSTTSPSTAAREHLIVPEMTIATPPDCLPCMENELLPTDKDISWTTIYRATIHVRWLLSRLIMKHPHILIPPLPDEDEPGYYADGDYVEKKRLQVERLLRKVLSRRYFSGDADVHIFLSNQPVSRSRFIHHIVFSRYTLYLYIA
jgi:hypothetical protein